MRSNLTDYNISIILHITYSMSINRILRSLLKNLSSVPLLKFLPLISLSTALRTVQWNNTVTIAR